MEQNDLICSVLGSGVDIEFSYLILVLCENDKGIK